MRRWTVVAWLVLVCLYVAHFAIMWRHAVNVPYWDEWDVLPEPLSLRWLFEQHNEHRLVFTKLEIWVMAKLTAWNLVAQQCVNFVLFGVLLVVIVRVVSRAAPLLRPPLVIVFTALLLSPLNHENHAWAFQSQVHFALLFLYGAIDRLFLRELTSRNLAIGSVFAACGMFCFSSGLIAAIAITPVVLLRARRRSLIYLGVVGAAVITWSLGFHKTPGHPKFHAFDLEFWQHYVNLVSMGFGFDDPSVLVGALAFVLVAGALGYVLVVSWRDPPYAAIAAMLAVLGMAAGVSYGRAAFGPGQAKSSRYAELMGALPLLLAAAWSFVPRVRLRTAGVAVIFVFAFIGYADDWSPAPYAEERAGRLEARRCVLANKDGDGPLWCEHAYPGEMRAKLWRAKEARWSFLNE